MIEGEAPHAVGVNVGGVVAIEGGRSIAARDVQAEFAKQTEELSHKYDMLAGFAIMVWDDEGEVSSVVYFGKRSAFGPVLIPSIASEAFKRDVMRDE